MLNKFCENQRDQREKKYASQKAQRSAEKEGLNDFLEKIKALMLRIKAS